MMNLRLGFGDYHTRLGYPAHFSTCLEKPDIPSFTQARIMAMNSGLYTQTHTDAWAAYKSPLFLLSIKMPVNCLSPSRHSHSTPPWSPTLGQPTLFKDTPHAPYLPDAHPPIPPRRYCVTRDIRSRLSAMPWCESVSCFACWNRDIQPG